MKHSMIYRSLFALLLVLTLGVTGCKRGQIGPTPIPGQRAGITDKSNIYKQEDVPRVGQGEGTVSRDGPIPIERRFDPSQSDQDRGPLASYTVYFDFDRSAIKSSETGKIESVARYLKGNSNVGVLVEGHCDERGTEQYNLSLGERRALAIREYLINL